MRKIVTTHIQLCQVMVATACIVIGSTSAYAQQTYYVRSDAAGAQNGTNWTDAFTRLPATLLRGATYYIADGSYIGSVTFNTPESGSAYIYIKKATPNAHGTDAGWGDEYGDGVAAFTGTWSFTTGYWDIDGVTGGGPGQSPADWPMSWTTGHGISQTVASGGSNIQLGSTAGRLGFRFRHLKLVNQTPVSYTGSYYGNVFHMEVAGTSNATDVLVDHIYIPAFQGVPFHVKGGNDWTIQHSYFEGNGVGNNVNVHRELWSGINNDRFTWRWNYILNINNTAVWAFVNEGNAAEDIHIYGNIIDYNATGQSPAFLIGNDPNLAQRWRIFNNTVVGWRNGSPAVLDSGTTAVSRNNLYANHPSHEYGPGWDGTVSHNAFYNLHRVGVGDVTASWASLGSSSQTFTADPFVNYAARDLRLRVATQPGSSVDSPAGNSVDMFGNPRGADGVWDRGALESSGSASTNPPGAPTNVRIVR